MDIFCHFKYSKHLKTNIKKWSIAQTLFLYSQSIISVPQTVFCLNTKFVVCTEGMTTFYYYSVNHHSGLQRNTFSKLSYIFLIHQNVPQIITFYLMYIYDGFIGQKILILWRQESRPFGPGWSANITRIRSWTFCLPW